MVNDLISRQAAIELLEKWAGGYSYLEVPVSSIAPKINELPVAEITLEQIEEYCRPRCLMIVTAEFLYAMKPFIEKKKGKWINGVCSECGEHALFWAMSSGYCASNYCPNCGAKMEN